MQLKTVGESLTVLDAFDNVFNKGIDGLEELDILSDKLKACSVDSVKLAISQRDLTKDQIKTALSAAGLKDEVLETTTAELAQVVADKQLAKSKAEAAGSTTGLGTAMKGLWNVLKTNPLFWIATVITAVTTVAFNCANAIKEVRDKASDLSNEFNSSQSEINGYKEQINDLYKVINDSGSSIEEVTTARQNLMTIQDQLIEKFGDEKETIDLITQAIYGQTTALDTLTQKQWQATKNEFNKSNGFWNGFTNLFGGYSDNIDRMLDEYGDYNTRIDMSIFSQTGKWNGEDTEKALKQLEELGYTISRTNNGTGVPFIELSGNASEVYDDLLEIQNLLSDESFGASSSFKNHLTSLANEANDMSKTYEDMYNQYVLYEEIFTNSDYKQSFKNINDAYKDYQDAFVTGDQETIDKAVANFSNILTQATEGADSESVVDYFNSMYPELSAIVDKWEFKTNIIPKFDTTGIQGMSEVDILKMTQTDGLQEGEEVFNSILEKARDYNLVTGTTNEQIEQLIDLLIEWGILQGDITDELQEGNETEILSTEQLKEKYESLNSVIDDIQSNYNTLASAVEEYNSQGYLSLDTLQSLINMDSAYLACLIDENGQLSINTASLDALIQAKLDEAEATAVAQAMTELDAIARGEATVATTDYITGNANLITSLGLLAGQYDNVAEAAMTAAQAQELSAQIANANKVDSEATKEVMDGLEAKLALIKSTRNKTSSSGIDSVAKSSSSSSTTDFKDILDKYLNLYEAELNAGIISFDDFLSKSRSMLDQYYREGKISAADYWGYVEDLYKQQLSIYDKVLSAVERRFDKEIDKIKDTIEEIEKQNDALEKQKDEYDSILSVVEDVYDKKIDSIKAEQDSIQDTIDKLQDENDERQRQIDLEKARYQLYQSLNNRNVKLYNGVEFVYTTNADEVKEAQQNLADLELEETIHALEKEKEALDTEIEKLEEFKQKWQEVANVYETEVNKQLAIALWGKNYEEMILSNRISDIKDFKNNYVSIQKQIDNNQGLIDSYNEKIVYYEALKSQWSSVADAYENTQEDMLATQILGADWENQILSGRMDTLNTFKNNYIATQQAIVNAAWNSANEQNKALNSIGTGVTTGGGTVGNTSTTSENYRIVDTATGKVIVDGLSVSEANAYFDKMTEKLQQRRTIEKYASGTENAKKGIHQVSENGDEIILDNHGNALLAKGKQLHLFEGGETVIKSSETIELLRNQGNMIPVQTWFTNIDTSKFMENMPQYTPNITMPKYDFAKLNHNTGTTPVVQNINLTLPNVTNESGYERLQKELHQMQLDALQLANKRY